MIRKSIIIAAAALAIALPSAAAFAAPAKGQDTPNGPNAPVVIQMNKDGTISAAPAPQLPPYADLKKGAIGMLTQFKTMLVSEPKVSTRLKDLPAAMDKLPALEKAYIDAKNAGDEAAASKAFADYTAAAKAVVDLALPLDVNLMPIQQQIGMGFAQLGPTGAKLVEEPEVKAIFAEIETILAPLAKANELVGPLHDAALEAAQLRIKQETARIEQEEFANQVNNYLQGKLAQ